MANPDKTPLERLSWLQRQAETVPCVFVRTAELEALEAEVVRLRQERDEALKRVEYLELIDFRATAAQWEAAFKHERAEVVRLRQRVEELEKTVKLLAEDLEARLLY